VSVAQTPGTFPVLFLLYTEVLFKNCPVEKCQPKCLNSRTVPLTGIGLMRLNLMKATMAPVRVRYSAPTTRRASLPISLDPRSVWRVTLVCPVLRFEGARTWESRLKLFRDGEDPHRSPPIQSPAPTGNKKHFDNGVLSPNSVSQTESSSVATNVAALQAALNTAASQSDSHHTAGNARPPTSPVTPLTANDSASSGSETSSATSSRVTSPQPIADSAMAPTAEDTEPEEPAAPQVAAEPAPVPVPVPPPVQRSPGQILSDQAVVMYQKYVGLLPSGDLELDWQQKVNKGTITVDASKVAGSTWQAIRGKMLMQAQKEKILDLLLNDDRIGEFDDMFDFYKV
jgi:hypothetical protein